MAVQPHPARAKAAAGVDFVDSRMMAGSVDPNSRLFKPRRAIAETLDDNRHRIGCFRLSQLLNYQDSYSPWSIRRSSYDMHLCPVGRKGFANDR